MYDTKHEDEFFVLLAIDTNSNNENIQNNLEELFELVKTYGGTPIGKIVQKREKPHATHYIGKGKIDEIKNFIKENNATGIVCDDELTSIQLKTLSSLLEVKVMDRTMIILNIFAKHAKTAEGKIQVELAQLQYNSSHLIGLTQNLTRQGGSSGEKTSRGPGEKKLELDRRYIRERIMILTRELTSFEIQTQIKREKRKKNGIPVISMVGYTNAGKTTLMNLISDEALLAMNKPFATLDTTTRKITLPGESTILYSDTVGFINKLPHTLIKAFKATLEELKHADILVHVVDASSETRVHQMYVVYKTLEELDCLNKPIITVFNKTDKLPSDSPIIIDKNAVATVSISALNKIGIDKFLKTIENTLKSFRKEMHIIIPYSETKLINIIYGFCQIIKEEHRENGIYYHLFASNDIYNKLEKYIFIRILPN